MVETHLPALIALTYLVFSLVIPIAGMIREQWSQPLAVLASAIAAALSLYGLIAHADAMPIRYFFGGWLPPVGIEFVYDGLSAFMLVVVNGMAVPVLIHARRIAAAEFPDKTMPFYSVAMLMMLGFNGMILTGDLFNLFVFLEIASLSGYALIAIGTRQAPFAAFRYLIIGTVGGSLFLLGVGFLYHITGTLNIIDMADMLPRIADQRAVVAALLLLVIGIAIKAAVFPMHGWLPDSYTFASSTSTALIAPIGTKVAAYVLIRILFFGFGLEASNLVVPLNTILGLLAVVGILYGSIMAIPQWEMKRMLAYSSIAQIGYIVLGLSLGSMLGFIGAALHILSHAVMKGCLFMVVGTLRLHEGHTDIRRMDNSYRRKYPWTFAAFTVAAISMIGLPPLAGFFSKYYLVLGSIEQSNWIFLAVILISSLLNAVYFFRILERVYLRDPWAPEDSPAATVDESAPNQERQYSLLLPILVLGALLFVIGFGNVMIVDLITTFLPEGAVAP